MSNHKGPPVASITVTNKKGDHDYGKITLQNKTLNVSTSNKENKIILCTYSIPFHISIPEFLEFVTPVDSFVSHYKVICDITPDTYLVLMNFRDPYSASSYYKQYNNRQFSSMEPEKCQVIYVEMIEMDSIVISPFGQLEQKDEPLSNCPVCLEPMDESTNSLLTILCQHTFHSNCLSKWGDASCPVCRYSQKPTQNHHVEHQLALVDESKARANNPSNECSVCHVTDQLWICLMCGHLGCGRYTAGHAFDHYRETHHIYALEIESQRVWDYAGDGYVHRLIQNAVDGKLVELPSTTDEPNSQSQEKLDALSIEYSYLLTSQLDSQRIYYEKQLTDLSTQLSKATKESNQYQAELDILKSEKIKIETEMKEKEKSISKLKNRKERSEKQLDEWKLKFEERKRTLLKEKETTNALMKDNDLLLKNMNEREKAIQELSEQVRDLMFFLEAREKVQGHPELEGGSVETHTPHHRNTKRRGKRS